MKVILNNISLESVITYLPNKELDLRTLTSEYGEKEVDSIIKATGVEHVYLADENETSSDMCFKAAKHLFEKENIEISTIDGIVFSSQTEDYILPATSVILQNRLGISQTAVCMDVHYGCTGYIYGLFQAACWIATGACKKVLVLAGDTTSKLINPKDKSLRMVFGDCGTATIVSQGDGQMGFDIMSDGSGYDKLIVPAGGFRSPANKATKEVEFDTDNNGRTKENLFMDGMGIFNFAITHVHKNVNELLEMMEWEKEDIGLYAIHQANNFMVKYVAKKLKADMNKVPMNVEHYGNTGPATIPLLLSDCCPSNYDLSKVVMTGFGVGLSWGSIATDLSKTKFYKPFQE